jgi:hypothetical protein
MAKALLRTTRRASGCALGESRRRPCCLAPLRAQGQGPQQTVRSRPSDHVLEGLWGLLGGAKPSAPRQGTMRRAPAVPRACGRTGWAAQATLARPLQASTPEPGTPWERVAWSARTRSGPPPRQRCAAPRLGGDGEGTPRPMGAQADGRARPWLGRHRSQTGRTTGRFPARASRAMRPETWGRGQAAALPALQAARRAVATRRGWTRARRQRLGRRRDGGLGTTASRPWVRSRGSPVVAQSSPRGRGRQRRQVLGPWPPPASPGRARAAVLPPHRVWRTTRPWGIRTPREKGGYHDAVWVTTWTAEEPGARAEASAGRALMASSCCPDQPAWGLGTRWQRRWAAQPRVLLVARLAPQLLVGGQPWVRRVPATRWRVPGDGWGRLLRAGWAVPGVIRGRRGWRVSVRFSPLHPLAPSLQASFAALFRGRVRVGCLR